MSCCGNWFRGIDNRLERNTDEAGNSASNPISGSGAGARSLGPQIVTIDTLQGPQTLAGSSRPISEPLIQFRDWDIAPSQQSISADQDDVEHNAQGAAVTSGLGDEAAVDIVSSFSAPVICGAEDRLPTSTNSYSDVQRLVALLEAERQRADRAEAEKKMVEAEKERAEEQAEAEKKRAGAEKERADAEKKRADAEKERADAEKERADRESEYAEITRKRMSSDHWLTTRDLEPVPQKQESRDKYRETVESSELAPNCILRKFLPPLDWLKENKGAPVDKKTLHRSAPKFVRGVWNEDIGDGGAHRAHLVPYSWDCCMEWLCLFVPFVVASTSHVNDIDLLCLCMLVGLKVQAVSDRYTFSGFLHSFINFIPLRGQERLLDLSPTIMFVPMLGVREILFWNGEPYRCLIIGKEKNSMNTAGFSYVTAVMPQLGAELVDTESFCELRTDDQSVIDAFKTFCTLLTLVVPFLASQQLKRVSTLKAGLCSIFRAFLTEVAPVSGTVPDVMCPTVPKDRVVVCLKFQRRDPEFPAFEGDQARPKHSDKVLTALPHPFLMFLRALNVWFNCLHSCKTWPAWNQYFDRERSVMVDEERRKIPSTCPLILLPSCRDMDMDSCTCMLCKSADVVDNPELYPVVSDDEWRAVTCMQDPTASPITEEEADMISVLRRRLVPDGSWEADNENEAEAGATMTGGDAVSGKAAGGDRGEGDADGLCSTRSTMPELPV